MCWQLVGTQSQKAIFVSEDHFCSVFSILSGWSICAGIRWVRLKPFLMAFTAHLQQRRTRHQLPPWLLCGVSFMREIVSSLNMAHEMNLHLVSEQSSLITAAWASTPPPLLFLSLKDFSGYFFSGLEFTWKLGGQGTYLSLQGKSNQMCAHVFVFCCCVELCVMLV